MDLSALQKQATRSADLQPKASGSASAMAPGPTAAERVLAAELQGRGEACDALSMMVSSIARMVQAGKTCDSRWKAS
ncbi:MAG: hypothetical protein ACK55H_13865 [Cyanobacteriota bacterium]